LNALHIVLGNYLTDTSQSNTIQKLSSST
jgi:hypothetical protein